jgi:hypothetical protein
MTLRIEQDIYRLLLPKFFYWKLSNAYITMLRNLIASKVAVGLLNTFNNKIIIF